MKSMISILGQRRMVFSLTLLLSLAGLAAWMGMVRQEDPAFPYRYGYVLVQFPGADVEVVERLIADPLEEEISEVEQVDEIQTTIRAGFLHVIIGMKQTVYDTDAAWDRVRDAVETARRKFPEGTLPPVIDDKQVDASTVVLTLGGSSDIVELQQAADRLKKRLYALDAVSRVRIFGDSGEQVTIALDDSKIESLGLTPEDISQQLQARNHIIPGGFVDVAGRQTLIRPQTEYRSLKEIEDTPILIGEGRSLPLSVIADIKLEVIDPAVSTAWVNGEQVVAIAVTIGRNTHNVVQFGEQLRAYVDTLRAEFAPLSIKEMFFQPDRVEVRLRELGFSLLLGVVIVAVILFLVMGLRMGITIALIVPLVTLSSLSLFAMGGGVLHQMAVAGMVIALGMLVDNAIVMTENIQWHMDRGASRLEAAVASVRELAGPLGAATGTTMAVFIPMLIARGDTADFTRAIPTMIVLMLVISYLFAIIVTPLLAEKMLSTQRRGKDRTRMANIGSQIGSFAVDKGRWVIVGAVALLLTAGFLGRYVDKDFFPTTDRNQLVVDIYYPEGTTIDVTTDFVLDLGDLFANQQGVRNVYAFSGNSGPRFYYNLNENPRSPQIGRLVIETEDVDDLLHWVRDESAHSWPAAQIVARRLAQGPPAPAPVEIRLVGGNRAQLASSAEKITAMLREIPGTTEVRHNLGIGIPSLRFDIEDAVAESRGINRQRVANALATQTQGVEIGRYRAGDDPVSIVLRSPEGSQFTVEQLLAVNAYSQTGKAIPVLDVGQPSLEWQPAVIRHYDLQSVVTVFSELEDGFTYPKVYEEIYAQLPELGLPENVRVISGGYQESSGEANIALFQTLPIGLILLLFFLLIQFNSFRRVGIVLVTVPLAITGVIPGLLISGYSFGFMALLGVIALVGIVVNNAIVLIDVVDANVKNGLAYREAVIEAVSRRTRPILLTTLTTVAGLLPLTFANSTLWPPMAWSIISGLIASTILTLGVIPTLCYWLLPRKGFFRKES